MAVTNSKREQFSPVVYLHWGGSDVPHILCALRERMQGRNNDIGYAAARLVGICHERIDGNVSLGLFEFPKDGLAGYLDSEFSHGDAGVILVECDTWIAEAWNGYGFSDVNVKGSPYPYPGAAYSTAKVQILNHNGVQLLEELGTKVKRKKIVFI
jgi:hypothetical protein